MKIGESMEATRVATAYSGYATEAAYGETQTLAQGKVAAAANVWAGPWSSAGAGQSAADGIPLFKAYKSAAQQQERAPFEAIFFDDGEVSEQAAREAVERANRMIFGSDRKFEISIHEKTQELLIKVVDTQTNQVIREIPPKKIVDLVVSLCELAGIMFDQKG